MRALVLIFLAQAVAAQPSTEDVRRAITAIEAKTRRWIESDKSRVGQYPSEVQPNGSWKTVGAADWTSGFFPAMLWRLYAFQKEPYWMQKAEEWTRPLEGQSRNRSSMDIHFSIFLSYREALQFRKKDRVDAQRVILQSVETYMSRFDTKVGAFRSWDFGMWKFPVVVDSLMNLKPVFWASRLKTDASLAGSLTAERRDGFAKAFDSHLARVLADHQRSDGSFFHLVDYSTETGKVRMKGNFQGHSTNSSWSRGQAWAVHSLSSFYCMSKDEKTKKSLDRVITYVTREQPNVPPWDYRTRDKSIVDTSAAAILADGFLLLSNCHTERRKFLRERAGSILSELISPSFFLAKSQRAGILDKGVRFFHRKEGVGVPLIFGDYYLLSALIRWHEIRSSSQ